MDLTKNNFTKISKTSKLLHTENEQSQYQPYVKQANSKKTKKEMKNINTHRSSKYNSSTWTLQENLTYKQFLKSNVHLFELQKKERRVIKINVLISKFVKTRTPQQCRSHHQKMLIYHKSISSIVSCIESLQMKQQYNKVSKSLACDQTENIITPSSEMKEIDWEIELDSPSLWDCIVQDVWIDI